jgi:hypothetical protein
MVQGTINRKDRKVLTLPLTFINWCHTYSGVTNGPRVRLNPRPIHEWIAHAEILLSTGWKSILPAFQLSLGDELSYSSNLIMFDWFYLFGLTCEEWRLRKTSCLHVQWVPQQLLSTDDPRTHFAIVLPIKLLRMWNLTTPFTWQSAMHHNLAYITKIAWISLDSRMIPYDCLDPPSIVLGYLPIFIAIWKVKLYIRNIDTVRYI